MKTIDQMLDVIERVDGADFADRHDAFVRAFYEGALKSEKPRGAEYRRLDAESDGTVTASGRRMGAPGPDPDDLANRSARGETDAKPGRKLTGEDRDADQEQLAKASLARANAAMLASPSKADARRAAMRATARRSK